MDRKYQLSNVAFGGAWSERIADREALAGALDILRRGAKAAHERDPRRSPVTRQALELACGSHPKGDMLAAAWNKGAGLDHPAHRVAELARIARLLAEACGGEE